MKYLLASASVMLLAAPAYAGSAHQMTLAHEGHSVAVNYEAKVKTTKRQIGIGPRATANCRWTTEVTVQRNILGADGQPIAALTRVVEGRKVSSGSQLGLCAAVPQRNTAAFGGNEAKMQQFLAQSANTDAHQLRAELASVSPSHRNVAR